MQLKDQWSANVGLSIVILVSYDHKKMNSAIVFYTVRETSILFKVP